MPIRESHLSITWHAIHAAGDTLRAVDRGHLMTTPDVAVRIGDAPDGLPLVMRVTRSASVVEPVLRALHANDLSQLTPDLRTLVKQLNERVQSERKSLGVLTQGKDRGAPHYVSMTMVPQLFGDTLLARLLGTVSPLLMPEDTWSGGRRADQVDVRTSAGVLMSAAERVSVQRDLDRRLHLAVPLDDGPALVATDDGRSGIDLAGARPLILEDLRRMKSARFHGYRRIAGENRVTHFEGQLGDNDAYRTALRSADAVGWSVTRADLLRVIAEVARSLIPLHRAGLVHGDIKTANVLITDDGATAHDSLDIKVGSISAVGTRGWNAPEQVIARPCTPATDVFALSQLVVQVLEAAVFGDERSFIVPVGGGARVRERLIAEPDVYLDPNLVALDDAGIEAWRGLLRRCLVLDTDRRISSAEAFADAVEELIETRPVPGRRVVTGLAGRLVRRVQGEPLLSRLRAFGGRHEEAAAWMLDDSYAYAHRTPWHIHVPDDETTLDRMGA